MALYTIKSADGNISHEKMEQLVAAHNIKAIDFKIGRLVVEAEPEMIVTFKASHPDWVVDPVTYADNDRPKLNLSTIKNRLAPK